MAERRDAPEDHGLRRITAETARYIIAGALTTGVNFAVFALLRLALGLDAKLSQASSIAAAVLFAYAANKLFVFRSRAASAGALALEFFKFAGGRAAALLVEYYGFIFLSDFMLRMFAFGDKEREFIAKAATQGAVLAINYAVSKLFVFKTTR
jgi:putative flippase GtrA